MSPTAARRQPCISPVPEGGTDPTTETVMPSTTAPTDPRGSTTPLRRALRRLAVTVAGTAVIAAGVAMLVLPGPGLVTIALGLSLLGREHAWAAALEQRVRDRVRATVRRARPTVVALRPEAHGAPDGRDRLDRAA